jgi:hypothetical protein
MLRTSSSSGFTTLSWVLACSTIVEHSQQKVFTECRCQRYVKPPTLRTKYWGLAGRKFWLIPWRTAESRCNVALRRHWEKARSDLTKRPQVILICAPVLDQLCMYLWIYMKHTGLQKYCVQSWIIGAFTHHLSYGEWKWNVWCCLNTTTRALAVTHMRKYIHSCIKIHIYYHICISIVTVVYNIENIVGHIIYSTYVYIYIYICVYIYIYTRT